MATVGDPTAEEATFYLRNATFPGEADALGFRRRADLRGTPAAAERALTVLARPA